MSRTSGIVDDSASSTQVTMDSVAGHAFGLRRPVSHLLVMNGLAHYVYGRPIVRLNRCSGYPFQPSGR